MRLLGFACAFALTVALLTGAAAAQDTSHDVNLGAPNGVLELKDALKPYHPPANAKPEPGIWYTFTAVNLSNRPVTRVLHAGQPPFAGLSILPVSQRPAVLQIASANPGVVVENSNAYGRKGYRVNIPAATKVSVAVRMAGGASPPSLLAWTEPELAAHNRQIAIFIAAVAGLIGAAAVFAFGLAVMTHHWAPSWSAASLAAMLLTRLASIGMFDGSIATAIGGPYGLTAAFGGLSLAAGIRFVDLVVPLREVWPAYDAWVMRGIGVVLILSGLAYVGLPGATLLTDALLLGGPVAVFVYLIYRARLGSQPAHVLQPAAGLFAMVSIVTTFAALGGLGSSSLAPDLAGGFAAAGSIMLALAVTAGEGITVIPWRQQSHQPHPMPHQSVAMAPLPPRAEPVPHAALEAIDASRQGVFELDLASDTAVLSAEAAGLVGMPPGRMPHHIWTARIHREDRGVYEQAVGEFRKQSGLAFRIEFRVRSEDGRYPWCELRATMKGPEGEAAERCVGLLADVTTRKEAEAEMVDRSIRDPLTGLGNRVALVEELEALGDGFGQVLYANLDIDRFKSIHASLGDAGGDEVLNRVAQRLTRSCGTAAQVFRVGGDCFGVLIPSYNEKPADIGTALVQICAAAHQFDGRNVFAPASVGLAAGHSARDPIDLLKNADLALMQAKRQGGSCACVFSPEMAAAAPQDAVTLEADLHRALDRGEIEVFYQPIIRLADRTVAGFEALLRWRHPTKGVVEPSDFIEHSEQTGIIVGLGQFALERAAQDLAQWQRYFPLPEPLFVSVNLSRRQLRDPGIIDRLAELIHSTGLAPDSFKLEMTESIIATDADVRALAGRIRALGAGLAIDDFGTGVSSLSQFSELPFDTVKIDKSFLARQGGTDAEANGDVVLASIVSLAHELKRAVIVEGVETEADADKVAELGCEYAQGYLYSEPVSAAAAMEYIARYFRALPQSPSGASRLGGQA